MEDTTFWHLISEVTAYHHSHVLLGSSKPGHQPHTEKRPIPAGSVGRAHSSRPWGGCAARASGRSLWCPLQTALAQPDTRVHRTLCYVSASSFSRRSTNKSSWQAPSDTRMTRLSRPPVNHRRPRHTCSFPFSGPVSSSCQWVSPRYGHCPSLAVSLRGWSHCLPEFLLVKFRNSSPCDSSSVGSTLFLCTCVCTQACEHVRV